MKDYVEFTGKTLDDAINDALSYFGVEREKLEIEIVNDAKTGIFGLVGAKKATVRARRVQLAAIDLDLGKTGKAADAAKISQAGDAAGAAKKATPDSVDKKPQTEPAPRKPQGQRGKPVQPARPAPAIPSDQKTDQAEQSVQPVQPAKAAQSVKSGKSAKPAQSAKSARPARVEQSAQSAHPSHKHKAAPKSAQPEKLVVDESAPDFDEQLPHIPLESIDQEQLRSIVLETLSRLIHPIVGDAESSFSLSDGRVNLQVHCADNHGLLIGRDGQTLASLQYLISCIASRRLGASVRVQIDAGDYREKQDEKLRELALSLAQKVKHSSRPQSTRPLSAYHRRIIHMALQDDPEVQTHSKGEGGLKRVVVVPKRKHS
ncbi:MAG: Jag N-terminal domain-containing protein [Deltaproteobacteria bacterium]|nr:Jag N-terminal domain-containing protein [Deltaproteobacteria bacterium]